MKASFLNIFGKSLVVRKQAPKHVAKLTSLAIKASLIKWLKVWFQTSWFYVHLFIVITWNFKNEVY